MFGLPGRSGLLGSFALVPGLPPLPRPLMLVPRLPSTCLLWLCVLLASTTSCRKSREARIPGPKVQGFARYRDLDRSGSVSQGDLLIVPFDSVIQLKNDSSAPASAFLRLSIEGDSLGDAASIQAGPAPDELTVVLGSGASLRVRQAFDPALGEPGSPSGIDVNPELPLMGIEDVTTLADAEPSVPIDIIPAFSGAIETSVALDSSALAFADLDRDGFVDLVEAVETPGQGGGLRLFPGDGQGSFTRVAQTISGAYTALAVGDADKDGDLDLVAGSTLLPTVVLYNEAGSFSLDPGRSETLGSIETRSLVLGDIDEDGDLDLVVANRIGADFVWLNDGKGSYKDSGQRLGNASTLHLVLGDLDRDGDEDLVAAGVAGLQIFRNDGGTFKASGAPLPARKPRALLLGDVDGNGFPDLVVANAGPDEIWLGDRGSFTKSPQVFPDEPSSALALADYDSDGDLDLASASATVGVRIWLGDGKGGFRDSRIRLAAKDARFLAFRDVNRDGDLDLSVAEFRARNSIFQNSLAGAWGPVGFTATEIGPSKPIVRAAGDLDRDGNLDLVTSSGHKSATIRIWLGEGAGRFRVASDPMGAGDAAEIHLADFDSDGDLDILVNNSFTSRRLWVNLGDGSFDPTAILLLPTLSFSQAAAFADLDLDGDLDLFIAGSSAPGENAVLWNGNGPMHYDEGGAGNDWLGWSLSAAGDTNRDGFGDFLVGAPKARNPNGVATGLVQLRSGRDGGIMRRLFGASINDEFGSSVSAAGDVDGDGHADVLIGASGDDKNGADAGAAFVFSGKDGSVIWTFRGEAAGDKLGTSVAGAGDVNRDAVPDLVLGAPNHDGPKGQDAGMARIYSGRTGALLRAIDGDAAFDRLGVSVDGAGDVDADGFADVILGAPGHDKNGTDSGLVKVVSGRDGSILQSFFGADLNDLFGQSVSGLGDVDGDGHDDLVVGAFQGENVQRVETGYAQVFSGKTGKSLFTFFGLDDLDSFGRAVSGAGDLNGDGVPDILVGAEGGKDPGGVRTGYVHVFSGNDGSFLLKWYGLEANDLFGSSVSDGGDLNRDGAPDFLVGSYRRKSFAGAFQSLTLPRPGVLGDAGLRLGNRLTFSVAIADVNHDGYPDIVSGNINSGTTAANMIWLNDRKGGFVAGQEFGENNTYSLAVADVNRDGHLDIVAGNNPNQTNNVWLGDATGQFKLAATFGKDFAQYLSLGDIDHDGRLDFLSGDWDNNPAANHVWLNRMPASFQPILLSRTEQSGAACLADVDRDGDLDLLLGPKIWLQK